MAVRMIVPLRNLRLNEIRDLIDAGAGPGLIRLYDGVQPATIDGAVTNLLAEGTFSNVSAPNATAGTLTANAIAGDASADASGTPTWGQVLDSDANIVFDFTVGSSGTDLVISPANITAGQPVDFNSFVVTEGNA